MPRLNQRAPSIVESLPEQNSFHQTSTDEMHPAKNEDTKKAKEKQQVIEKFDPVQTTKEALLKCNVLREKNKKVCEKNCV